MSKRVRGIFDSPEDRRVRRGLREWGAEPEKCNNHRNFMGPK